LVLQRESDVVKTIEQAVAGEVVDLEGGGKSAIVFDLALLQVDNELIVRELSRSMNKF